MGIDVYIEDQTHTRTSAGSESAAQLLRVLAKADPESLLAGVHPHGDTMFNTAQLHRLDAEMEAIATAHPELSGDVVALRLLIRRVVGLRGYLWLSGD